MREAGKVEMADERWQLIESAPNGERLIFWVVAKTSEEAYVDTSGNSIFKAGPPHLHIGTRGTWSSLEKATHWMPLPDPPDAEGQVNG